MTTPYNLNFNMPELGTLEDLLVALRVMEPSDETEVFSTTLAMEDYNTIVSEVAALKGISEMLPL
jgi:hypothetical protein